MPIEVESSQNGSQTQNLNNVSAGGLCFHSDYFLPQGISLTVNIPNLESPFSENCTVEWCSKVKDHYDVGVSFDNYQTVLRMRMIEQICYIEDYRKEVLSNENRAISAQEASREWNEKFSGRIFKI